MTIRMLVGALVLNLAFIALHAQATSASSDTPKSVVEAYWRLGENGALLTAEGWDQANTYFIRPNPTPTGNLITVVSEHYSVEQISLTDRQAEVDVVYEDCGKIDGNFIYTPPVRNAFQQLAVRYHLVESLNQSGKSQQTTSPPLHWSLSTPNRVRWAGVGATLGYLVKVSGDSTDPTLKKNAANSIAKLKKCR